MISSLIFGAALIIYAVYQTISNRGRRFHVDEVLWASVWAALLLLNGLFGQPYIQNFVTNAMVFLYAAAFLFGHTISFSRQVPSAVAQPSQADVGRRQRRLPGLLAIVVLGSAVGMIAPYELANRAGYNAQAFLDANSYAETAASVNGDFRTGLIEQTLVGKVAFAIPQAIMLLVGISVGMGAYKRYKRTFLVVLAAAPLVAFSAVSTIRSSIFIPVVLFFTSWLSGRALLGSERSVFRFSLILRGVLVVLSLCFVMFFFQSVRLGDTHFNNPDKTLDHLRLWVSGYVPAFNGWLWNVWDGRLTFGSQCFRFIAGTLQGSTGYVQTVQSNIYVGAGRSGNAATMLRPAINDFGMLGCAVFLFMWGAASRYLLTRTREGSMTATILFACNLSAIVWSPNAWYFAYGSRVLAPMLAIVCVLMMTRVRLFARPANEGWQADAPIRQEAVGARS